MKMRKTAMLLIFTIILACFGSFSAVLAEGTHDPYMGMMAATADDILNNANGAATRRENGTVGGMVPSHQLYFKAVDFGQNGTKSMTIQLSTGAGYEGKEVAVRLDSKTATPIGTVLSQNTGWTLGTHTIEFTSKITGVHDVYISTAGYLSMGKLVFNEEIAKASGESIYTGDSQYSDIADNPFKDSIYTLCSLGLLGGITESIYEPQLAVTRAELAKMIFKIMSGEDYVPTANSFADVTLDNDAFGAVEYLYSQGVVSMPEDKLFNPDRYITTVDAAVMCLRALGYKNIADIKGGYPNGYMTVAREQKLTKGLSMTTYLRRDEMAGLIENMLNADYLDIKAIDAEGNIEYDKKPGILSLTRGIERGVGVVSATSKTTLGTPVADIPEGSVIINDKVYGAEGTPAEAYFGCEVTFFYTEDGDVRQLVSVRLRDTNESLEISTYGGYSDINLAEDKLSYTTPDGENEEISLKADTSFVYNGKAIDAPLAKTLDEGDFNGKITYIDNTERAVVMIEQYRNIVVQSMNEVDGTVIDAISGETFDFDTFSNDIEVYRGTEEKPFEIITTGSVLTVYASKNTTGKKNIKILFEAATVTGTVEKILEDKVYIDGEEFAVAKDCVKTVTAGLNAVFSINSYGEIVTYSMPEASENNVAVLIGYLTRETGAFNDTVQKIRVYNKEGQDIILPLASKVYIDGVKCETFSETLNGKDDFKGLYKVSANTLVVYNTNENGEITMLDTYLDGAKNTKDVLKRLTPGGPISMTYIQSGGLLVSINSGGAGNFPYNLPPEFFFFWTADDPETITYGGRYTKPQGEGFRGDAYTLDKENPFVQYVIMQGRDSNSFGNPVVFDHIEHVLTDDGDMAYKIVIQQTSGEKAYTITEDKLSDNPDLENVLMNVLQTGDIIQLKTDFKGYLSAVQVMLFRDGASKRGDISATLSKEVGMNSGADNYQRTRYLYGTVVGKYGQFIEIEHKDTKGALIREFVKVPTSGIILYDHNDGRDYLKAPASIDNISINDKVATFTIEYALKSVIKLAHPDLQD